SIVHLHQTLLHESDHHFPRSLSRLFLVSHARSSNLIRVCSTANAWGKSVLDVRPVRLACVHFIIEFGNLYRSKIKYNK
ncbi:hypothetical protein PFISCL1PPCAC_5081, partial [Pristionchus fissidentatus]